MSFVEGIPVEEIIAEYENGKKLKKIAKENNVAVNKLRSILIEKGGLKGKEIVQKEFNKKYKTDLPISDIVKEYENGKDCKKIANDYGVSPATIHSRIFDYEFLTGEKILRRKHETQYRDDVPEDMISAEYHEGKTTYDKLAKKYHISEWTIKSRVDKYDMRKTVKNNVANKSNEKIMNLSTIYNYLRHGYDLEKIEKYVQSLGYSIDEEDLKTARKIETGELIVANEQFIYEKLRRLGHNSYERLCKMAEKEGYIILKDIYYQTITNQEKLRKSKRKIKRKVKRKGDNDEIKNEKIMPLSMIYDYLSYGYNLENIEKYAQSLGYTIDGKDIETAKKIQKGELKVATGQYIYMGIQIKRYSYEEMCEIAEKEGYVIFKDRYDKVKKQMEENKRGVGR